MLRFFPFMATGLLLLAAVPAGAASLDSEAIVTRSIADFVRPGYVRFHDATTALDKAAATSARLHRTRRSKPPAPHFPPR